MKKNQSGTIVIELNHSGIPDLELEPEPFDHQQLEVLEALDPALQEKIRKGCPVHVVDMETGEELEMQTDMHELSPLAVTSKNTYSADMLKTWMETHGFTGIVSEWWHFEIKGMKKKYATFQVKPYEGR